MHTGAFIGVHATRPRGGDGRLKRYWFVWDDGDRYLVQPLDGAYQPAGDVRPVSAATFRDDFEPQPGILAVPLRDFEPQPARDGVQGGDAGEDELEHELRAGFALGMTRLCNGDREGALRLFEHVLATEEGVGPVHKHLFTEFGIHLRKRRLLKTACDFHRRVLALSPEDSHAHFNAARALYEDGDIDAAVRHLNHSLNISPDLEPASLFLAYIERHRPAGEGAGSGGTTTGTTQETRR